MVKDSTKRKPDKSKKSRAPKKIAMVKADKKNNSRSYLLKFLGGAILLFSFISQHTILNYWENESSKQRLALTGYMSAFRASLQYLDLYLTASYVTEKSQEGLIEKAAHENALGQSMMINVADLGKSDKKNKINEIMKKSKAVHDLDSYTLYMNFINRIEPDRQKFSRKYLRQISTWKSISNWVYLSLYILGSVLVLASGWLDWRKKNG